MSKYLVVAFYHYTRIPDAPAFAGQHLAYCKGLGIRGRIYIAEEGINGTISGTEAACTTYMNALSADPLFSGIEFKADPCDAHVFTRMHCRYKKEIVNSGMGSSIDPLKKTGKHLHGKEFQELKAKEDVVLLDVRSNYETRLGKFKDAITLNIDNFREFPQHLPELEVYKNKKVVTYCTGGIKCEKASAFLLENGFKDVYQLHNGIVGYSKETGGKDFDGVLYVFDGRITVPVNEVNPEVISRCKRCGAAAARNLNCANVECNEQFVMCEACSDAMEGACSDTCQHAPGKRAYNGTGYYVKPPVE